MNKKELIISAFEKMDITMLDVLLNDSPTYQEVPVELFLQRLSKVFDEMRTNGDLKLTAHAGVCCSNECSNKGCNGYSFVGNNKHACLNLIFEETENSYKDIYHCNTFKTNQELPEGNYHYLNFYKDEEANFTPSPELAINLQKFNMAFNELATSGKTYLLKADYEYWLEKHTELFSMLQLPPMLYKQAVNFYWLYNNLNSLSEYTQHETICKQALIDFETVNEENEMELLAWLVKYESTGMQVISLDNYTCKDSFPMATIASDIDETTIKVDVVFLKNIFSFRLKFFEHYWPKINKYGTSEDDFKHMEDVDEIEIEDEYQFSLDYQLTKRGIIPPSLK